MSCVICKKQILNSHALTELSCKKHIAHGSHMTVRCPVCTKESTTSAVAKPPEEAGLMAKVGSYLWNRQEQTAPSAASVSEEDHERQQRKYLLEDREKTEEIRPIEGSVSGVFGRILNKISEISSSSSGRPDEESSNPFVLLKARVPLKTIVEEHGYGIVSLINQWGVKIGDFFDNGYTMTEMCDAFGTRLNRDEGLKVLQHLGMKHEDFRAHPELSEIGVVQTRLGYKPQDMINVFGYRYSKPGPYKGDGWTLPELVNVGLRLEDVMSAGLDYKSQWEDLARTAAHFDQIQQFGARKELIDTLRDNSYAQAAPAMESETGHLYAVPVAAQQQPDPRYFTYSHGAPPPTQIRAASMSCAEMSAIRMQSGSFASAASSLQQQHQRMPASSVPKLVPRKK